MMNYIITRHYNIELTTSLGALIRMTHYVNRIKYYYSKLDDSLLVALHQGPASSGVTIGVLIFHVKVG